MVSEFISIYRDEGLNTRGKYVILMNKHALCNADLSNCCLTVQQTLITGRV